MFRYAVDPLAGENPSEHLAELTSFADDVFFLSLVLAAD